MCVISQAVKDRGRSGHGVQDGPSGWCVSGLEESEMDTETERHFGPPAPRGACAFLLLLPKQQTIKRKISSDPKILNKGSTTNKCSIP